MGRVGAKSTHKLLNTFRKSQGSKANESVSANFQIFANRAYAWIVLKTLQQGNYTLAAQIENNIRVLCSSINPKQKKTARGALLPPPASSRVKDIKNISRCCLEWYFTLLPILKPSSSTPCLSMMEVSKQLFKY